MNALASVSLFKGPPHAPIGFRMSAVSAAPRTDTACRLVLRVVRGSPGMVVSRLNTSSRSPVSPLSPAATTDHRPDPDFTVCPMSHMLVGAVKPGGSRVMFRRYLPYRTGFFWSWNLVMHANYLHAVSDHGMPLAAMTDPSCSGHGMKVYEVRLGMVVQYCIRVLIFKAQARS